ncbi:hypothetical protein Dimus_013768, partial [Dionaea muscipula]
PPLTFTFETSTSAVRRLHHHPEKTARRLPSTYRTTSRRQVRSPAEAIVLYHHRRSSAP